jgi:hypothetical protein
MARFQSADEVRAEYLNVLGPDVGPFMYALRNELLLLHLKWEQYRELFGASESRVAVLNEVAGTFVGVLFHVMWDDILLHIARLTDRPRMGRNGEFETLSVRRLPELLHDFPIAQEVEQLANAAATASVFVRDWRNQVGAHRDLDQVLKRAGQPLSRGSRQQVEMALKSLCDVFNCIERHAFHHEGTLFEIRAAGDATALLYHLRIARDAIDARRRRLQSGQPIPEDMKSPREI